MGSQKLTPKFGIALTNEGAQALAVLLKMFDVRPVASDSPEVWLPCMSADFSGLLISAEAILSDGDASVTIWFPHSFLLLAFQIPSRRPVGFLATG